MVEEWKPVVEKGFDGLYEVSNLGNVRSIDRNIVERNTGYIRHIKGRMLKKTLANTGYYCCTLSNNCVHKLVNIHRLVAEAHIPNPDNLPQVNHRNEVKTDNRVENLEWCSCEYNLNYGTRNDKLSKAHTGKTKEKKCVPIEQYDLNGNYIKTFPLGAAQVQRELGIRHGNVWAVANGRRKSAGGFIWKYKN